MEKNAKQALLSRIALVFGIVAATGAFAAGNCNVRTSLRLIGKRILYK
jgi:hypothetical protein